jgi:hypothetical protein
MSTELTIPEELTEYGPCMRALTGRQRKFVTTYMEYPTWSVDQLAKAAGYSASSFEVLRVTGQRLMHEEKVLAAMHEEAGKRIKTGGLIGVSAVIKIALNEQHKDHLKAALALMDRTGFHALSEHKVQVTDDRPKSKQELIAATREVLKELGMSPDEAAKFLTKSTGEVVDVEFTEVAEPVQLDPELAAIMEDM